MLTMSGFTVKTNVAKVSFEYLKEQACEIMEEGRQSGWEILKITAFHVLQFFFTVEEMHRCSKAEYMESNPFDPFSTDDTTTMRYSWV